MEQNQSLPRRGPLSASALKVIAVVAMVVDHSAGAFFAEYYAWPAVALHTIGRITAPLMFYFIAEGTRHTCNPNRYTLRLAVFAAVSYLPFIYYRTGALPTAESWSQLNVIYTLLLGHLAVRARHEIKEPALKVLCIALCFVLAIPGDWGWLAVLYILVFDLFAGDFPRQAGGFALVTLTQLMQPLTNIFTVLLTGQGPIPPEQWGFLVVRCAYFLPLGLLCLYSGQRGGGGRWGKWFFYVFYPAHLLVLGVLRTLYGVR